MKFAAALFLLIGAAPLPAAAAEAIPGSCQHATAQQDVNFCIALKASAIGAELESTFLAEIAHEKDRLASDPESLGKVLDALQAGHSAWQVYARNQCASEGYMAMGGTLESQLYGECVLRLGKARIAELKQLTDGLGN